MTTSQHVHTSSTPESFLTPAVRALENARTICRAARRR